MQHQIMTVAPDGEIVYTRIVKARKDKVFRAWSDPEHLKNWWEPEWIYQ